MTVGRWSLGALVVAVGWTVLGASASAHASDRPNPGLLGTISEVTTTLTHVTTPVATPVAAAPVAVVPAVASAAAPLASAVAPTIGATTAVVAPIVPPVPAIVLESVTASTPPVVETLVTTIAGTPLVSAVTTPVVSLVTPLEAVPVVGPTVVTPILNAVDSANGDLPSVCAFVLGGCVSVTEDAFSDRAGLQLQGGSTFSTSSSAAGTSPATAARLLAATASSAPGATISARAHVASPDRPAAPTTPSGNGLLTSSTSVNASGGSAGANSATVPAGVFFRPAMADEPHGHSFSAHSGPADDLSSSPD